MAAAADSFFSMLLLCAAAMAVGTEALCPDAALAVYPFRNLCDNPAQYLPNEGATYRLLSASEPSAELAPEWDETNATYYVRLSSTGGATYGFTYATRELRPFVRTLENLFIVNVDSGRYLGWRDEDGEKFLVELIDSEAGSFLRFNLSSFDQLACILPLPTRACSAYDILAANESGDGVGAYVEDGVTYFRLQSDVYPFLLTQNTGSTASSVSLKMSTD